MAGAVATPSQWDGCERAWGDLLLARRITAFHAKEFNDRSGEFDGWSEFKRRRFVKAQERIIDENTVFEVAVAVERDTHAKLKTKLRGLKGFRGDSDYGLAFRVVMFIVCHRVAQDFPDAKVQFIVEDGPWAAGAATIYQSVSRMQKPTQPARYAHMLGGFASLPKGRLRSLEAADYLADRALSDLKQGKLAERDTQLGLVADANFLENWWHSGVLREKERRRLYGRRQRDGEG